MWIRAALVSTSIGRKTLDASSYFILQAVDPTKNHKSHHFYRVITKHFPHYKVAEGNEYDEVADNFRYLNEVIIPLISGKKSSKSIAKWLKIWYDDNFSSLSSQKNGADGGSITTDEESSILSRPSLSMEPEADEQSYLLPEDDEYVSRNHIPASHSMPSITDDKASIDTDDETKTKNPTAQHENPDTVSSEHSTTSLDDVDNQGENWWSRQGLGVLSHWFESPVSDSPNRKQNSIGFWDVPIQFVALLTYPEVDQTTKKKLTYAELKEVGAVKGRRKVLLFLTLYTLVVRWCSFDLFLLILFMANCGVLFLMKNSGKINMQMAKRTVRQRANYMKQWAGGLFKKNSHGHAANTAPSLHRSASPLTCKGIPRASTDSVLDHPKHKMFFNKKNHSQLDPHQFEETKHRKKLFGKSSSKASVASVPTYIPNNSEPELNKVDGHAHLMSIDNSSF
ncbi:hypothetical protein K493DRAFT_336800 [Basidiobolus meristosporus CBS 931.73]|uniref:Uncharacterized protein n=1 Tax=Basidiobolus meristosporus CBS 931.73 TaxID=1314790 RepID=A0A1Y1YGH6_9FUNG|nr:hypothetical protein K493DRAFT_336800 [Basidiobolus meristosporus CBS 931.73]|eukprot:ORX96744.1 hypothetical protein K493DRAFT_336800 [Basidiobolus meristosporus CBS 931.73]